MASLNDNLTEAIQDDGTHATRMEILASEIAESVSGNRPAKRKRNRMDIQDILQDPLQTATEDNDGDNTKFPRNWKPPQGITTFRDLEEIYANLGSSSTMLNELRGHEVVHEFALRKTRGTIDLRDKHKLEAAYIQLTGEQSQNPCKQCLAGKGPFELCVHGPAKRCGNCYYRGVRAQCSFLKTGKENGDASSRNPQNSQAEKEGARSTSDSRKEETGSGKNLAAPTSEAVSKPSQHADEDASRLDTQSVSDLQSEPGVGVGLEHHPKPEPGYQVGGRQLRTRPPRPPPRNERPPQRRQNTTATNPVTVGPNQQAQARHRTTASTNPTTDTNLTASTKFTTDTNPPANPPTSPSITRGIDKPVSPPSATATPAAHALLPSGVAHATATSATQALPASVCRPQIPPALALMVNAQVARALHGHGSRDSGLARLRQQQDSNTTGLSARTGDRDRNIAYNERDGAESRATDRAQSRATDMNTDSHRDRERDRERGIGRERTPIVIDGSFSLGGASASPANSILACLPPNTPVEIMRCLMQYHQNQADELRLEHRSISRNRSAMALWQGEGGQDTGKDKHTRAFGRAVVSDDAGPSSILACLGGLQPNHSPLETMQRLGLHYQFQADELRLECLRIEREERMRRERERGREWEREREGEEEEEKMALADSP